MTITRKMLKAMELDEDKISQIIDAHQSVIDEIAGERDKYKAEVARLTPMEKELVKVNAKLEDAEKVSEKYKALQDEFNTYKADIETNALRTKKENAYRELLKEAGVSEKRLDSILKVSSVADLELDEDGKFKNSKDLVKNIKDEWSDFIVTVKEKGIDLANPPANGGDGAFANLSLAEKMAFANEHPDDNDVKAWLNN